MMEEKKEKGMEKHGRTLNFNIEMMPLIMDTQWCEVPLKYKSELNKHDKRIKCNKQQISIKKTIT